MPISLLTHKTAEPAGHYCPVRSDGIDKEILQGKQAPRTLEVLAARHAGNGRLMHAEDRRDIFLPEGRKVPGAGLKELKLLFQKVVYQ